MSRPNRVLDGAPATARAALPETEAADLDRLAHAVLARAHRRAIEAGIALRVLASSRAVVRPLQITGLYDLLAVEQPTSGVGAA